MISVFGKAITHKVWNLGFREAESPGWFDVLPKISGGDMMHEWVYCRDEAANHQLPIAAAFWIIRIFSTEECSSLTQNLMQIHSSTHSVILNVIATQYTCSLNGVYCPHWLVQWSRYCSYMCIPFNCPWLLGYNNDIAQTILIVLTMAGLFLDRPCISNHIHSDRIKEYLKIIVSYPIEFTPQSRIKKKN